MGGPDKGIYYDAHSIEQMRYHLTMLAYDMNGAPLSFGHGAPLRLRNETQLGFKQVKWIKCVEFVADFADMGGGYGGYNQDHEILRLPAVHLPAVHPSPLPAPRGSRLSAGTPTGLPSFGAARRVTPAVGKHGTPVHIRDRQRHRTEGEIRMEKFSLTALARQQLTLAQAAASGRSSRTVYGGHEHVLRQTVIALAAGQTLDEHENPGEATLHILHGRVRLGAGETSWDGSPSDLLIVPDGRHTLEALEPAVVLLTVAKHR